METITLTEEEKQKIRTFIFKADRINIIQCVYILSYFSKEYNKDIIEVTAVINYSKSLNENKLGTYSEGIKYLYDKVQSLVKESCTDRLVFKTDTSYNYSIINMNNINIVASRKLLSSTILLDQINRFQKIQNIVGESLEPYNNVNTIDNIDELINNQKVKTLKKTNF